MGNPLLDLIGDAGYALDTPGAYLRGALAGRPGDRVSGQDMLGSWGVDAGPLGGLAAEAVADPLALAGLAGAAYKGLRGVQGLTGGALALSHADDANPLARALAGFVGDESGALRPFQEIGRRTDPDWVNARDWFHGNATPGLTPQLLDPMRTDADSLFGRGLYKTDDPWLAGEYADMRFKEAATDWGYDVSESLRGLGRNDFAGLAQGFLENPGLARPQFQNDLNGLLHELRIYRDSDSGQVPHLRGGVVDLVRRIGRYNPEGLPAAQSVFRDRGFQVPDIPVKSVYRAATNHGKIMDVDGSISLASPDDVDAVVSAGDRFSGIIGHNPVKGAIDDAEYDLSLGDLIRTAQNFMPEWGSRPGDPIIESLRNAGYDALTHTGGLRAGGGKTLHDVLISLDPNDTVSRVGRAHQITRFDPLDPEQVRQLTGWR